MQTAKPKIAAGTSVSPKDRGTTSTIENIPAEPGTRTRARSVMRIALESNPTQMPVMQAPMRKTA